MSKEPGMGMSVESGGQVRAAINLTPMIDVLLVLIVIFMVIAPVTSKGFEALIPESATRQERHPEEPLVISVLADGTLRLNSDATAWDQLEERLGRILSTRGDRAVFVRGERGIDFQPVAEAIDLANTAGATRVGLMEWK
jgi:biopolymer transport protein ExbD